MWTGNNPQGSSSPLDSHQYKDHSENPNQSIGRLHESSIVSVMAENEQVRLTSGSSYTWGGPVAFRISP